MQVFDFRQVVDVHVEHLQAGKFLESLWSDLFYQVIRQNQCSQVYALETTVNHRDFVHGQVQVDQIAQKIEIADFQCREGFVFHLDVTFVDIAINLEVFGKWSALL